MNPVQTLPFCHFHTLCAFLRLFGTFNTVSEMPTLQPNFWSDQKWMKKTFISIEKGETFGFLEALFKRDQRARRFFDIQNQYFRTSDCKSALLCFVCAPPPPPPKKKYSNCYTPIYRARAIK